MSENINEFQNRIDFIVNGGALKTLTDFLNSKNIKTLIVEPDSGSLNVLDAAGVVPEGLKIADEVTGLFTKGVAREAYEINFAQGPASWPGVLRVRGSQWQH